MQTIQKVQRTVEVPQVQYIDRVVDVPVVMQRQVPTIQTVQKTVDFSSGSASSSSGRRACCDQLHMIQKVQRMVEFP